MIALRNKLYESLLDDEEDLIKDEKNIIIDIASDAGVDAEWKGSKLYINNRFSINNDGEYLSIPPQQKLKLQNLSETIFNRAEIFNNKIEFISNLSLVDEYHTAPNHIKIPITSHIDIKNINKLRISSSGFKSSDNMHIDKYIKLSNIDTLSLSLVSEEDYDRTWVVEILKNVKVDNFYIHQLSFSKYDIITKLKQIKINKLYVPYRSIPGISSDVIKMKLPPESTEFFDLLIKNNKIGKIFIGTKNTKKVKSADGAIADKSMFELVKTNTGYKLVG